MPNDAAGSRNRETSVHSIASTANATSPAAAPISTARPRDGPLAVAAATASGASANARYPPRVSAALVARRVAPGAAIRARMSDQPTRRNGARPPAPPRPCAPARQCARIAGVSSEGGWPYASWGMTADEIVAASGGTARRLDGAEQDDQSGPDFTTLAVDGIEIGPFAFDVSFRAARGASVLRTIRLELRDAAGYDALRETITADYGPGEPLPTEPDGAIEGFSWTTPAERVVLRRLVWPMDLGVDVVVDYEAPDERA